MICFKEVFQCYAAVFDYEYYIISIATELVPYFFIILPPCAIFAMKTELHVHQYAHMGETFSPGKINNPVALKNLPSAIFLQNNIWDL